MRETILHASATGIAENVRKGEWKASEVTEAFLDRIEKTDPKVRAFLRVLKDSALEQSRQIDEKRKKNASLGLLAGVPVAVKDNIHILGNETTCGSKILKGYISPYDAHVIDRLKAEDAVLIGKTNLDEFAMGSSTENSAFFPTRNPWALDRVPGGSSGGSAAAVACRMAPLALGSDTGGSIRQPAAFCGVVGVKPTYGLVSRYGLVAFASSLDQIGPFARNVQDAALLLKVIAGHDPRDSTSARLEPDRKFPPDTNLKGLSIGLPKEYFIRGLDPEVENAVRQACGIFESLGAKLTEISLPHTPYALSVYYLIAPSEASSNLARYDGIRYGHSSEGPGLLETYERSRGEGFGPEVKRRIMLGTHALSSGYYEAYYGKAQRVRTLIREDFDSAFKQTDLILTPTAPTPPFKMGEKAADPLQMYLSDVFTIPCNLAGICGVSIPCGFSQARLPIGLQLLGKSFGEERLLGAAWAYESSTPWHREVCPQ